MRPHRSRAERRHRLTVVVPFTVYVNIGDEHRLAPVNRRAATGPKWANRRTLYLIGKSRKAGCHGAVEMFAVGIWKPDRARDARALRFDHASYHAQHFRQR